MWESAWGLAERFLGSLRHRVAFRNPHPVLGLPRRAYSPSRLTPNAARLSSPKSFRLVSVLLAFLIGVLTPLTVSAQSSQSATKVPATIGTFKDSNSGAGTYTLPISVPPGTSGMAPKLGFVYNSQDSQIADNLLGIGWSLSGLPTIQRCPATVAQDGFRGGINYDSNDRFCLDGQRY